MGLARIEVDEYTCELCGYKWINRVNGKDGPVPKRCAKCKHQHWERGPIDTLEKRWRDAIKKRFGYFRQIGGFHGSWQIETNVKLYLQGRPSVEEMKVLLHPMCYRYTTGSTYRHAHGRKYKPTGCVPTFPDAKKIDWEATKKAHEYERELSRQLLKDLMTERGIPYDEKEAKIQSLYSRHGKYGPYMLRHVPELCDALKKNQPEWSNEAIKTKILKQWSEELKYMVASPEELIESCWPDWLTKTEKV